MALLTDEIQEKLIKLLIDEGLVEKRILDERRQTILFSADRRGRD